MKLLRNHLQCMEIIVSQLYQSFKYLQLSHKPHSILISIDVEVIIVITTESKRNP